MADNPTGDTMTERHHWVVDPEELTIPIRGECGHEMAVPLARVGDGQEFTCPVCGQKDRLDAEAIEACRAEIDTLAAEGKVGGVANVMRAYLDQVIDKRQA